MTHHVQPRVLVVGDEPGLRQSLAVLPRETVTALVAASNRPQYHDAVARLAAELGVPMLIQPPSRSELYPAFVSAVAARRPDLIFCNSYSMILPDDLLAVAKRGGVNVHPGKVPEYRGANPVQWALINDERQAEVTVHHMTSALDAGDVIASKAVEIRFEDGWRAVAKRLREATMELLVDVLPQILEGSAPRHPQSDEGARRWPRRTPEDGRIDWSSSALEIYNLVRALGDGLPPAFYEEAGRRVEFETPCSFPEVVSLKYAPGPGGRRLRSEEIELVPTRGAMFRFDVVREGRVVGCGLIEDVDSSGRTCRVSVEPPDTAALRLLRAFARAELGLRSTDESLR